MDSTEPFELSQTRTNWLHPKFLIPLMIVLMMAVLISAPFVMRHRSLATVPDIGDPFDVDAFCNVSVPDEENAFVDYRLATATISREPSIEYELTPAGEQSLWSSTPAGVQEWVLANRKALAIWKKGTAKPKALYLPPREYTFQTLLEEIQTLRSIARMAVLEGSRLEDEGDVKGAWDVYFALYRCSRHLGRHGCAIERLIGMVLHNLAVDSMIRWAADPRVDQATLQSALAEVQKSYQDTEPISNTFKVEYIALSNTMQKLPRDVLELARPDEDRAFEHHVEMFVRGEPEFGRRIIQHWFANLLESVSTPAEAASLPKHLSKADLQPIMMSSPMARAILPASDQFIKATRSEQIRQGGFEMVLAAQIHYRKTGAFPNIASELLDNGLTSIPFDSFALSGGQLQYRREMDGSAVVWSVGDNGSDEKGDLSRGTAGMTKDIGYIIHPPKPPKK